MDGQDNTQLHEYTLHYNNSSYNNNNNRSYNNNNNSSHNNKNNRSYNIHNYNHSYHHDHDYNYNHHQHNSSRYVSAMFRAIFNLFILHLAKTFFNSFVGQSSIRLTLDATFDTRLTNPNSGNFKRLATDIQKAVSIINELMNPNMTIYSNMLHSKYFISSNVMLIIYWQNCVLYSGWKYLPRSGWVPICDCNCIQVKTGYALVYLPQTPLALIQ